MVAEYFIHF